jgi:IS1 family transposase
MSINSISRFLHLAATSVRRRILKVSCQLGCPLTDFGKRTFEIDELYTYVVSNGKTNPLYVTYALDRKTRIVADFVIGSRSKLVISKITDNLIQNGARRIYTDRFNIYPSLIPSSIQRCFCFGTNIIERMNLGIRNSLKRMNRKAICFSRSIRMLEACLKIYFWYK